MRIKELFRQYFFRKKLKNIYENVIFGSNFILEDKELLYKNLLFKGSCYIGKCANWSIRGKIIIGDNVIFGPYSVLWTYNHNYDSDNYIPYGPKNEDIISDIIIEDNVWLGRSVTILGGVKIGEGAIIGANSIVVKDIPPYSIAVGNPAKVVKRRNIEKYNNLKENNKLYLYSKKNK
ncbi:acyltransferase [Chishuiella sp.]|uniref:acyltransferase n=1 Tax=Chishuiella sp. TaxID=1969467 RepID=UPI0028ACC82D|nr:acyltransferase [Chishuiella sp.]